jgi:hypothetical protein
MPNPEQQKLLEQLLARLEPNISVGASSDMVAASIAISLKRIADHFDQRRTVIATDSEAALIELRLPPKLELFVTALIDRQPGYQAGGMRSFPVTQRAQRSDGSGSCRHHRQ